MSASNHRARYKTKLRAEILVAARTLVQAEGYERLTLRKVAQRMGYSPMALYSYFADKHALLLALAQEGFERLADRLRHRVPTEPLAALRQTMTAYVEYGVENPQEYRIVFMFPEPKRKAAKTGAEMAREQDHAAFALLLQQVKGCLEAGTLSGDALLVATLLWAGMHGVTSLLITFPGFPFGERVGYVAAMADPLLAGLGTRSERPPEGRPVVEANGVQER